ncbi:hypothetical protein [Streptomyces endocoffeicus]|uniref:hypothetical protein n=1 Tax=Streptomyces endocoffeicus TaxID=2898945 RepID=UPI001E58EFA5|nr:hypothetical protein [Streptomyces endocoffeicus]
MHRAYEQGELDPPAPAPDGLDIVLTADQHYLLQARADDQSYKAIAKIRGVRIYDVRQAERALMSLLGAKSPAHLMKRGRELGLLGVQKEASSSAAGSLR